MVSSNPAQRAFRIGAGIVLIWLGILPFPRAAHGGEEPFPGYAPAVRLQAEQVVAAAGPGREEGLGREVRKLRILMHSHGVLSMNAVPDRIFRRAREEGWLPEAGPSLRKVLPVSPFSSSLWAWLVRDDLLRMRFRDLGGDLKGFLGTMRNYAPSALGYATWVLSLGCAALSWYACWVSAALFLRARPSLESDVARFLRIPLREYLAPPAVALLFVLPLTVGAGLAVVACCWLLLSAAYVRRGEILMLSVGVAVLVGLLAGGGLLHRMGSLAEKGGGTEWLRADGSLAPSRTGSREASGFAPDGGELRWMVAFGRGREAMQGGDAREAERRFAGLVSAGRNHPAVRNNRGVALAMQGRSGEALAEFEAAIALDPGHGPAVWNAYQIYLQTFNLERSRALQPFAWGRIQEMTPLTLRPSDMEQGEWIASPLPVGELTRSLLSVREGGLLRLEEGAVHRAYFRPFSPPGALAFLFLVWLFCVAWKTFSLRLWVYTTCRGCGASSLVIGKREAFDVCNPCRAQIGEGIRAGEDRDRRIRGIRMHRRYVRAAGVAVPGSAALWAGKEFSAMGFGALLSLALGAVSSFSGDGGGGPILLHFQQAARGVAVGGAGLLWLVGALWGIRSFSVLQQNCGIFR